MARLVQEVQEEVDVEQVLASVEMDDELDGALDGSHDEEQAAFDALMQKIERFMTAGQKAEAMVAMGEAEALKKRIEARGP